MVLNKIRNYIYYIIIFSVSIVMLLFLPMVGTEIHGKFQWPKSGMEWFIFIMIKLAAASGNVLITFSFLRQAEVNVKDNPKFIEANEILGRIKKKDYVPRSPAKWKRKTYIIKMFTIVIFSIASSWAFSEAILNFNVIIMMTYLFTVAMAIIFGLIQMKSAETYWTTEYYDYAKLKENETNDARQKCDLSESTGTSSEEQG